MKRRPPSPKASASAGASSADPPSPSASASAGASADKPARQAPSSPRQASNEAAPRAVGRVVIENVQPAVDVGRFPIKRTRGEPVAVTADVFADGHDVLAGVLKYRHGSDWREIPLTPGDNDSWAATFTVTELGEYEYTIEAWIDRFGTWLRGLAAKADAGQDVASELLEGADIIQDAAARQTPDSAARALSTSATSGRFATRPAALARRSAARTAPARPRAMSRGEADREGPPRSENDLRLLEISDLLRSAQPQPVRVAAARDPELRRLMDARPDRSASTTAAPLRVIVDPERARFSAWYEMFPRSCTSDPSRGATLREAETRLSAIADMGFDVLYLPPVHPIGTTHRKGRNNALAAEPGDPGSPWAIGSEDGGHTAIDPGLGTLDDFDRFVAAARHLGLEVALDIAFQASPDHPWVEEHPEWFRHRPDGSIKYAENPPKKYQDIYPFDFESRDAGAMWRALRDVFLFWIAHGVTIFRVDNPHTKPFAFWEWALADVRRAHPEAIFLSEAFTRPTVMRYLAKAGFNQSYTYFTWRNSAGELREYLTELTRTGVREFMRPNFFANTPDILHEYLQTGGRPAFEVRLILAATLSASYGIYSGFELCERVPIRPGSEEYLNSEKYEIKPRDWQQAGNLNELIARVNEIRRSHAALQQNNTLAFHETETPAFLWFSKTAPGPLRGTRPMHEDRVFVVANTDPHWMQHGRVQMPIWELGIGPHQSYIVEDLLDDSRYVWQGDWNYVKLDPAERVAHILVVRG
jgi:starch synthase (maltosyl-transferring)